MRISDLNLSHECESAKLSASIESRQFGRRELWFSAPKDYSHYFCTSRLDGFLVGMLFPAMQFGEDIHLKGCVSRKLLDNINNYVVPLLMSFSPSCKKIKITADQTSSQRFDSSGVGTGFSGGVDSFCTIYDRYELETSHDYKINKLVFLNVGSHGPGQIKEELKLSRQKFYMRYDYLKAFADEIKLEFIPIDSNLHSYHPWGHQKTHTLTSTAGILTIQRHLFRYYYSSSGLDYDKVMIYSIRSKDISVGEYCDPILLPLLSTESLEFISEGIQYTRLKKTLRIMDYEPVRRYLNVCVNGKRSHENCSTCSKCCRTLMTLNSAGKLDEFSQIFDIQKYKMEMEHQYLRQQLLLQRRDPFAYDNIKLARQNGIKLPSQLICYVSWSADKFKACRKALKKRLRTIGNTRFSKKY